MSSSDAPASSDAPLKAHSSKPKDYDGPSHEHSDPPARSSSQAPGSVTEDDGVSSKQGPKPNKVYIGGLPEHTRQEDLQSCFGKIGNILAIELKLGYGFVEFDSRAAAEESVAKYHEGYFMGNKIRVEVSHGGRNKINSEPGACFKCGSTSHWARECQQYDNSRRPHYHPDAPPSERSRDYPPPARDYASSYPPREGRYGYDYPAPPPRDYVRRSPPRDYRDYPGPPPPARGRDDYEYRMRGPPPSIPSSRAPYERPYYPEDGYPTRGGYGPPPVHREPYDRYDRRMPPPSDRYASYPSNGRARSPPHPGAGAPRDRDDYARREFAPNGAPGAGRPSSPGRFSDYPETGGRSYRRRSQSPPRAGAGSVPYDSSYANGASEGFSGNGFPGRAPPAGTGPPVATPPTRANR